jgi:MFS family permease
MALGVFLQYEAQTNFYFMLTAFMIHAVAFAFVSGAVTALLFDELKSRGQESRYAAQFSLYNFLQGVGLAVAMALGGAIQSEYSWQGLYYASAGVQFLSILPVLFMREIKHSRDHTEKFLKGFLTEISQVIRIALPVSLIHAAMTPYYIFSQKHLISFDISVSSVSYIMSGVEFLSSLLVVGASSLVAGYDKTRACVLLVVFSILLGAHFFVQTTTAWLVASVLLFFASSGIVLYLNVVSNSYFQMNIQDSRKRASIMSFVSFVDTAAIGVGYLFYGLMMDHFPTHIAIGMSAVFPLVSLLLFWRGRKNVNL